MHRDHFFCHSVRKTGAEREYVPQPVELTFSIRTRINDRNSTAARHLAEPKKFVPAARAATLERPI